MKPRSSLTLRTPPDVNANTRRKGNLRFQLPDSISPNIRRSVDQYVADVTVKYRNTLQTGGIKGTANQGNKIKSKVRMEARRREQRSEYLNLKRQGDELSRTSDVPMPSSAFEIETLADGASSLESLRQLITERKEYLLMSRSRKQKVQWYERVTRQSEQLLNFLKANDKSAGDTYINNPPNLVLAHGPAAAEPVQQEPSGPTVATESGATRPGQPSSVQVPGTATQQESKRENDATGAIKTRKRNWRDSGSSSLGRDQGKRMAKPSGSDGEARQDNSKRGEPSNPSGRMLENMQEIRFPPNYIPGNSQDTGTSKNKSSLNTGGDDKENEGLRGQDAGNDRDVFQRTTTGSTTSFWKDSFQHKRQPGGATATQHQNIFNGIANNNNVGLFDVENNGWNRSWKVPGVQPSSQPRTGIKRKRDMLKRTWSRTENDAKRCSRADMMGMAMAEAWTSKLDAEGSAMGSRATGYARGAWTSNPDALGPPMIPKPGDSLWVALRKMWKKQDNGGAECELEPLSRVPSMEYDANKVGATSPYKTPSRLRAGRTMRRRRDVKTPSADDEADYPVVPQAVLTSGPRYRRPFVIPDAPYEVEEAFSMDVINTGYDFIHNG